MEIRATRFGKKGNPINPPIGELPDMNRPVERMTGSESHERSESESMAVSEAAEGGSEGSVDGDASADESTIAARRAEIFGQEEEPPDVPRACFLDDYDHRVREREVKEANRKFNRAREVLDGSTRITAENAMLVHAWVPSLHEYRDKSKRAPDSLPARFYRMVMGEEWDGNARSYTLAKKKLWRLLPNNRQDERERQQRKKRDYSKKKRPTDDSQRRQARREAQKEREKACVQQQKQVGA